MLFPLLITLTTILPPTNIQALDTPNDAGGSITVTWNLSQDDSLLSYYEIMRSTQKEEEYELINTVSPGDNEFDDEGVENGREYYYVIRAVAVDEYSDSNISAPAIAAAQWFHGRRLNALILGILFCGAVLWFIRSAKKGEELFLRRIPGIDAVDEAVGRSTEMGKPILFLLGLEYIHHVATLAGLSILGRVAKKAAQYDAPIIVPCWEPVVMTAAQEIVKQAHMEAGRPDTYKESSVFFLTADQFGYAAGVDGIILREKPGAIFLMGYFYAESLILAETGYAIGAIQIAGTSAPAQLPFFVAACDYTLIGEELFAASSYLSKEPIMLGSIKGEDIGKLVIGLLIVAGVILSSFGLFSEQIGRWATSFVNWFAAF